MAIFTGEGDIGTADSSEYTVGELSVLHCISGKIRAGFYSQ